MSKILYICEKPSQAKDIARMLNAGKKVNGYYEGDNTRVSWCYGHLLELAPPDLYCENLKPWRIEKLPVIPSEWKVTVKNSAKEQFLVLKKLIKDTQHIVIATDADREGEVIAREVMDYCNYKGTIQRLWLSALDDTSIQKALNQLKSGSATEALYYAGLGRQRADWLVGMNMTMAASSLFGVYGEGVLSVGRVQTPTLKLVVDRDRAIEQFEPKDYFVLLAEFSNVKAEAFWTKWQVPEDKADEAGRCLDEAFIQQIAKKIEGKDGRVLSFTNAKKKQAAPQCLSLSALQKLASSKYGLSAKKVLDLAQSLYETHKATTYPRTDCGFLPESQFEEAKSILPILSKIDPKLQEIIAKCNVQLKSSVWNDKKITAHHAIIPTMNAAVNFDNMTDDERKVYDLIRRYYIAQFLGDYEYFQRVVTIECESEVFKASSHTPDILGWKMVLNNFIDEVENKGIHKAKKDSADDDRQEDFESMIPSLSNDDGLTHQANRLQSKKTKPPARFTEGTLIDAMKNVGREIYDPSLKKILKETSGIGTEATRANILETLFNREYLERTGKQLISTTKGRALIDKLPEIVTNPVMTAQWEQTLESVAEGGTKLDDFIFQQHEVLYQMLGALAKIKAQMPASANELSAASQIKCPLCQNAMMRRKGPKGFFYGCSGYPSCKGTLPDLSQGAMRAVITKVDNKYQPTKPIKYTSGKNKR